ncbi:MAG: fasciclin domain-containing protein [Acidobacteriota bacterium]|nr:fasciclin domain-containing protein [Acidobacteriota bacterium]MDH3786339.1 fasciclin domain-containing protein [Acidobacteriota bacterium]
MSNTKRSLNYLVASLLVLALGSFGSAALAGSCGTAHDIVDTAAEAGTFNTLVAAVTAAGLVDALKSDGPFTVFAPSDEAFAKLPKGTVESLLLPENKDKLTAILTYHVVAGKVLSADVKPGLVETLEGGSARLSMQKGNLMIDGATIVAADVNATNGVIHVIDSVIMPN